MESSYQTAQQEIKRLNEQIKALDAQLEKYKTSSVKLKPMTIKFTMKDVSFNMVFVKGGTFMMGANDGDGDAYENEMPAHKVTLSDYWIGETQVTQALWKAVMGGNPSRFRGDLNCPVEHISWENCQEFIQRLNDFAGAKFCLPTEAQWEFAARGGNLGKDHHYRYAGSDDIHDVAWFTENSKEKTHPVGELYPNELGLYDMSGNVWEWCKDRFANNYYDVSPEVDPSGPSFGSYCVARGGSWSAFGEACRVSRRRGLLSTSVADGALGLRLVLVDL